MSSNPCFNGISVERHDSLLSARLIKVVLILVLMEYQ